MARVRETANCLSAVTPAEDLLKSIYADFDPEIKIENKTNKYFDDLFSEKKFPLENVLILSTGPGYEVLAFRLAGFKLSLIHI